MTRLVILPGLDGSSIRHEAFIAALGTSFEVQQVQYPPHEPLGYDALEPLARRALPVEGTSFVLGESFSGPLAVRLAAANPGKVAGIILCGSFLRNPRPELAWLRPVLPILPLSGKLLARLAPLFTAGVLSAELQAAMRKRLGRVSTATLRARLRAVMTVDVTRPFAALEVPVLYLRASQDRIVPRAACELAARLKPRMHIAEIDSPHLLLQTRPLEAAQAVAQYVQEIHTIADADTSNPVRPRLDAMT